MATGSWSIEIVSTTFVSLQAISVSLCTFEMCATYIGCTVLLPTKEATIRAVFNRIVCMFLAVKELAARLFAISVI